MDENTSLSQVVMDSVSDFLTGDNAAMVTGFVIVTEALNADGDTSLRVVVAPGQPIQRSMGLLSYGTEWVKDDLRRIMEAFVLEDEEDGS